MLDSDADTHIEMIIVIDSSNNPGAPGTTCHVSMYSHSDVYRQQTHPMPNATCSSNSISKSGISAPYLGSIHASLNGVSLLLVTSLKAGVCESELVLIAFKRHMLGVWNDSPLMLVFPEMSKCGAVSGRLVLGLASMLRVGRKNQLSVRTTPEARVWHQCFYTLLVNIGIPHSA